MLPIKSFDEITRICCLIKGYELLKNIIKSGIKSAILLKKNLKANKSTVKKI